MAFFQNIHSSFEFICVCGCATAAVVVCNLEKIGKNWKNGEKWGKMGKIGKNNKNYETC
jgi:hypothetical protein